jgi:hypothetical protein
MLSVTGAVRSCRRVLYRHHIRCVGDVGRGESVPTKDPNEDRRIKAVAEFLPVAEPVPANKRHWSPSILKAIGTIEERQEFHRVPFVMAVEKSRCKYGFPRAYIVRARCFVGLPLH